MRRSRSRRRARGFRTIPRCLPVEAEDNLPRDRDADRDREREGVTVEPRREQERGHAECEEGLAATRSRGSSACCQAVDRPLHEAEQDAGGRCDDADQRSAAQVARLKATEAEIAKAEASIERYFHAFENGTMPEGRCAERVNALGDRLVELRARRDELAALVAAPPRRRRRTRRWRCCAATSTG
jgi:hypothetical protein